jgi:DNA polymerase-3 subunit gamma/tau
MRDALSLTDQAIAYGGGELTEEGVASMLGASHTQSCAAILQALARGDGPAVMQAAAALQLAGASATAALDAMAGLLQRAAVEQVVPGALADDSPSRADVAELAQILAPDELQLAYSIAVHGKGELALMSDEHAALVMILLRILAFLDRPAVAPASRSAPLRAPAPPSLSVPTRAVDAAPVVPAAPAVEPEALPPSVPAQAAAAAPAEEREALADRWDAVVRQLVDEGRLTGLVKELAWQGGLVARDDGPPAVWHLRIPHESLRGAALRDKLTEALCASLGMQLSIEVQAGDGGDTPARRDAAQKARLQAQAEALIREDSLVQSLLQQFSTARLVPGSVKPA